MIKCKVVISLETCTFTTYFFNLLLYEISEDMEIYSFTTTSCTFILFNIYTATI